MRAISRAFIDRSYNEGIIYEAWDDEQLSRLNAILLRYHAYYDAFISNQLESWENQILPQLEIHRTIVFNRDELERDIQTLENLKSSIDKLRN